MDDQLISKAQLEKILPDLLGGISIVLAILVEDLKQTSRLSNDFEARLRAAPEFMKKRFDENEHSLGIQTVQFLVDRLVDPEKPKPWRPTIVEGGKKKT